MPTLANTVYGILAACNFDAAAAPAFFVQRGFNAAITRTGAGDYTLTLTDACSFLAEATVMASLLGAVNGMISVEVLTTTTLRIRTVNAAAAATDIDFSLMVFKIAP